MSGSRDDCPICRRAAGKVDTPGVDTIVVECYVCGKYTVSGSAWAVLQGDAWRMERCKLSGSVRNASVGGAQVVLTTDSIPIYIATATPPADPLELIDRIVSWLATRYGDDPDLESQQSVRMTDFALFYRSSEQSFLRALNLVADAGYVQPIRPIDMSGSEWPPVHVTLTLQGWRHASALRSTKRDSWQAFVAMWFAEELMPAYREGIAPALRSAGYDPLRVDAVQHNGKIDDRIIAEIRRSGLVVADFTGHRGGVYFEAGFGMGLSIPVIWTCRQDAIDEAHFDTRQYNHITWSDPADLHAKLENRIRATLPTRASLPELARA